jgi:hypothetical protein
MQLTSILDPRETIAQKQVNERKEKRYQRAMRSRTPIKQPEISPNEFENCFNETPNFHQQEDSYAQRRPTMPEYDDLLVSKDKELVQLRAQMEQLMKQLNVMEQAMKKPTDFGQSLRKSKTKSHVKFQEQQELYMEDCKRKDDDSAAESHAVDSMGVAATHRNGTQADPTQTQLRKLRRHVRRRTRKAPKLAPHVAFKLRLEKSMKQEAKLRRGAEKHIQNRTNAPIPTHCWEGALFQKNECKMCEVNRNEDRHIRSNCPTVGLNLVCSNPRKTNTRMKA